MFNKFFSTTDSTAGIKPDLLQLIKTHFRSYRYGAVHEFRDQAASVKLVLKTKAKEIRLTKDLRRDTARMVTKHPHIVDSKVNMLAPHYNTRAEKLRYEYRYLHVAYCLVRGKKLEQIEKHNTPENQVSAYAVLCDIYTWFGKDVALEHIKTLFPEISDTQLKELR